MISNWWMPAVMCGLVLSGPAVAQAQTQVQSQAQGQAQAQTPQARIDAAMEAAARADIPVSLLASKVSEGEARRVPRERIAAAVEAQLSALVRAAAALRRAQIVSAAAAELSVAADALSAGVSENALVQLMRTAPPERRIAAVAILADLVRLGQPHEAAVARVTAAIGAPGTLASLQTDVHAQLQHNGLSSTLAAGGGVSGSTLGTGATAGAGVGAATNVGLPK